MSEVEATPAAALRRAAWLRLAGIIVVVGVGVAVGVASGAHRLTHDELRDFVLSMGAWGALAFIGLFVVGQILQVPGFVFVATAVYAWGSVLGGPLALLGAVIAVNVNFMMLKTLGGSALRAIDRPRLTRMLERLDRRPMTVMITARVIFMTSPVVTTTLALSGVSFRAHFVSSAIGMAPMVAGWTIALHLALA
jgi:uncharacterized membrane protein YdjX (TVP38/TMEM64 family)